MNKYLELCVDLKKSHVAKEGLFQYRNMCQATNVASLASVVQGYLSMAEKRYWTYFFNVQTLSAEKATKFCEISTKYLAYVLIDGDFAKFCDFLTISELY